MFYKIFIIIFCGSLAINAQYKIGAGYINKSEVPFEGISLHIERNLPFQLPDIGAKVRLEIDYLSKDLEKNYTAYDANLSLIVSYFLKLFQPHVGIGFGHSYFSSHNSDEIKKYPFHISSLLGFDLKIFKSFYLFFEGQVFKYFTSFDDPELSREIKNIQLRFLAGIKIDINIID